MASFNRVVLVGNLTRDPELRSIQSGTSVMDVGLAVNERRKEQSGNWVEDTNFFDVTVWGRNAEVLHEYARKGSSILVEGRLKQDTWEQEGQKRSKVKIIAERIVLLGSRSGGSDGGSDYQQGGYQQQQGGYQGRSSYQQQSAASPQNDPYSQEGSEEIPF